MPKGFERMVAVGGFRLPPELAEVIEAAAEGKPPYLELQSLANEGYGGDVALVIAKLWEEFYGELDFDESGDFVRDSDPEPAPATFGSSREIAYIPVPRALLRRAIRAVADLMGDPDSSTRSAPSRSAHGDADQWSRNELRRLHSSLRPGAARTALDLASARPGDWIALNAIIRKSKRQPDEARADMAALTRLAKRDFQRKSGPLQWNWGFEGHKQAHYRVDRQTAQWWNDSDSP